MTMLLKRMESPSRKLALPETDVVHRLEMEAYLKQLEPDWLAVHIALADMGILREPGPVARERATAESTEAPWTEEELEYTALLETTTEDEVDLLLLGDFWQYFREPGIRQHCALRDAETRLLAHTRLVLRQPDLELADVESVLNSRTEELESELLRRKEAAASLAS